MKRGSERQLTADAHSDSDEGESKGAGTWEKASGEELSRRKILRVKRDKKEATVSSAFPSDSLPSSNPFSANPFGTMKGFITESSAAQPSASTASVFREGFSFASAPVVAPVTSSVSTPSVVPNGGKDGKVSSSESTAYSDTGFSKFATFSSSAQGGGSKSVAPLREKAAAVLPTSSADGTYGAKVTQLNKALLNWMHQQHEQAPLGLWSMGLEDYVEHAERLAKEFGVRGETGAKLPQAQTQAKTGPGATSTKTAVVAILASTDKALFVPTVPSIPAASAPASAFTFGGADSSASAGFSWSGKSKETTAFTGGNYSLAPNWSSALPAPTFGLKAPAVSTASAGGLGFGAAAGPSATSFAPSNQGDAGDGDDDEGEPILEPEVILRDVNDKDEILFQAECSLRRLDTKAEPKPEWKDVGKGSLRVTLDPTTGVRRILVREKSMGKVTLNASFFAAQKFEKVKKNSIKFAAVVPDLGVGAAEGASSLNCFIIKTNERDTDNAIAALVSARDGKK